CRRARSRAAFWPGASWIPTHAEAGGAPPTSKGPRSRPEEAAMYAATDSSKTGVALGVGAGALWGLVFLAPALAREFPPLQLAIGRYLFYGLFSAALVVPLWRRPRHKLGVRDGWMLAWLSLSGNILYY